MLVDPMSDNFLRIVGKPTDAWNPMSDNSSFKVLCKKKKNCFWGIKSKNCIIVETEWNEFKMEN